MAERTREDQEFWSATLPSSTGSVRVARHFTQDALRCMGSPQLEEAATLLVSELATNAVLHAHSRLRLSVLCRDGVVRIEVRDDDPTLPRAVEPDPLQPGGRGIMLVNLLADHWGVNGNRRGKTVWFELAA